MAADIRIGKVSSVNYDDGLVRVTYPDKDDSTTTEIPVFSFTDEYKMPKVDSKVLVIHLSDGSSAGVVLGHFWDSGNKPPEAGSNEFHKELADNYGDATVHCKDRKITIYGDIIELKADTKIILNAPTVE